MSDGDLSRAYATLGVSPGASDEDVRAAYLTAVKRWHPDRFNNDPEGAAEATMRLRRINQAYDAICTASEEVSSQQSVETGNSESHGDNGCLL